MISVALLLLPGLGSWDWHCQSGHWCILFNILFELQSTLYNRTSGSEAGASRLPRFETINNCIPKCL